MKKIIFIAFLIVIFSPQISQATDNLKKTSGYVLLQVEASGEAWYVNPINNKAYYLGRPDDALAIMKQSALGAKHDFIATTVIFPDKLSGMILLDTERNGEAYYIYPKNKKKY